GSVSDAGVIFNNFKELDNLAIPFVGTDSTASSDFVKAIGVSVAKDHLQSVTLTTVQTPAYAEFVKVTQSLFNHEPKDAAANAYDAVLVSALAMQAAQSTNSDKFAPAILQVTSQSGATSCSTYADCLADLKAGQTIKYLGAGGPMAYDSSHQLSG